MSDVANVDDTGGDEAGLDKGVIGNGADQSLDDTAKSGNGADTDSDIGSLASGDIGDDDDPVAPADWPSDWRERLAGNDPKALARLKRFSSPANVMKSYQELEKKMTSGQFKKALAEDATPEEIEAFRKENKLPQAPEEYDFETLPDGYILSDDDKPLVDSFREFAFTKNMDPKLAKDAVAWFAQVADNEVAMRVDGDKAMKAEAIEMLRGEWGPEYRANVSLVTGALKHIFRDDLWNAVAEARLSDGSILGNNPEIVKMLADHGREILPGAQLMPSGTADIVKGIDAEIQGIEKDMNEDYHAYTRDAAKQARYLELLEAREKRAGRSA